MPSAGLARYQWRKHGMCSGLDETDYFALLVEAAESIAIPRALSGDPKSGLTMTYSPQRSGGNLIPG